MEKPEFRHGYTKLPNRLIERVLCKGLLTQYESQVVLAVARLSWGWNKTWCYSSYGELSALTGISRSKVYAVCKDLHFRRILVLGVGRKKTRLEINPRYQQWQLPRESRKNELFPPQGTPAVPSTGNSTASQTVEAQGFEALVRNSFKTIE
jgi:phage replication O-like protein O